MVLKARSSASQHRLFVLLYRIVLYENEFTDCQAFLPVSDSKARIIGCLYTQNVTYVNVDLCGARLVLRLRRDIRIVA